MAEQLHRLQSDLAAPYAIERELGRGAMAIVYLARDLRHDRLVALKVMRPDLADAVGAERFLREIRVAAQLQHPHILPVFDSGRTADSLFYVMPFVEGESLHEKLRRERQLGLEEALRIACEIADALQYAHERGVVHRDVKPENILISDGHALVADFGIARAVHSTMGDRLTGTGMAIGTPAYMSPEQAAGEMEVDGRSDQYALACVLFEMLAGEPPYTGPTPQAIIAQRFTASPPSVRGTRERVPPHVDEAIRRALSRAPADRFRDMAEFAEALGMRFDTIPAGGGTPGRRWWVAVGAALATVAIVGTGIVVSQRQAQGALDPNRYAVVPFQVDSAASAMDLSGIGTARLMYDAMSRWEGIPVTDPLRVQDALAQVGAGAPTREQAFAVAARIGAGKLVWGEVARQPNGVFVYVNLYDANDEDGEPIRQARAQLLPDLSDLGERFNALADSLLVDRSESRIIGNGALGTRVFGASRAHVRGHAALARWDIANAEREFRAATELDPDYADAHFWLAQTMMWAHRELPPDFAAVAARSAVLAEQLSWRERHAARALDAFAAGRLPDACDAYRQVLQQDSLWFPAWFGLGDCQMRDRVVLPEAASPTGYRFRSSAQGAIRAYQRALELVPSVHRAFQQLGYDRLSGLLLTEPNVLRVGRLGRERGDSVLLAAYPELAGDTLAFFPVPVERLALLSSMMPSSLTAALDRNRRVLWSVTQAWTRAFPESPAALEYLGLAAEAVGELTRERGGALTATRAARARASSEPQRARLAAQEVRLLLRLKQFPDARRLADSALQQWAGADTATAAELVPLAALTGRLQALRALLERSAGVREAEALRRGIAQELPRPVAAAADELTALASLGAPPDSLDAARRRLDQAIRSWVGPTARDELLEPLLALPTRVGFPKLMLTDAEYDLLGNDALVRIQRAAARGDAARVRIGMDSVDRGRTGLPGGAVTVDARLHEANIFLAIGDSARAAERLDFALRSLPTVPRSTVVEYAQAASLVRVMALRAELAAAAGDRATARSWAAAAAALWGGADPMVRPTVTRMQQLMRAGPE